MRLSDGMEKMDSEAMLSAAIEAVKGDVPGRAEVEASASRMSDRVLGRLPGSVHSRMELGAMELSQQPSSLETGLINNCGDVLVLLPGYRAHSLPAARAMLIEAHLRECGACQLEYSSGDGRPGVDWSLPTLTGMSIAGQGARGGTGATNGFDVVKGGIRRRWSWAPAMVAVAAMLAGSIFVYRAYWAVPQGVRAEVQSIGGSAYRISDAGSRTLKVGDRLMEGEELRTGGGGHARLRLADGSTVEVNERSELAVGARGHNMTLSLDGGAVIVEAAKRESGHLYVKTPDCRVAVTGTVFSVDSGIKGSLVGVLEGSVRVAHAGVESVVSAGDQMSTNANIGATPVATQIAWSQDRSKYLAVLVQLDALRSRIEAIPMPKPRFSSDLLSRVPAETLLYVSIPNLGNFLGEADKIVHEQLEQSPALAEWWGGGDKGNSAELDVVVGKLQQMSEYLGDEVVVVGLGQSSGAMVARNQASFAVVADLKRDGLQEFLKTQLTALGSGQKLVVLDQAGLAVMLAAMPAGRPASRHEDQKHEVAAYALVRAHEAVFSNSVETLREMNVDLDAGGSGFAKGAMGEQIAAAYGRGAGVILAADLHAMLPQALPVVGGRSGKMGEQLAASGMDGVQYLIAEHREVNGKPENHLNLQFSGERQRVASWLAAPAPIGSLEFVSSNAAVAVAGLSKDPKMIANDIFTMAGEDSVKLDHLNAAESAMHVSLRDDIAGNLGGDFLLAIDGPVLPTPSWKAVIEVRDSARMEKTLETVVTAVHEQTQGQGAHDIRIDSSEAGGQVFYAFEDVKTGNSMAQYTYADGYMIVAPSRALLIDALRSHRSGDSLGRSSAFKAMLPKDENENYSAVAYQNLAPVLTPLLSQMSGDAAAAVRKLAADQRPTAICAWGKDSRIEAASDSSLFGFDFLTVGSLMKFGNKQAN